jgi:ABC-type nickel/cobalt efflux system permease component RcnA
MTSIAMSADNWGERRTEERASRRRRRARWIVGAAVACSMGVPFLAGLIDGFTHGTTMRELDRYYAVISAAVFVLLAGWLAWRNWRETDEVQRQLALRAWAAMGMAALALHPLLIAAQPVLHLADPGETAWIASLGVGCLTMAYNWVRS